MFLKTFLKKSNKSLESTEAEASSLAKSPLSKGRIRTGAKLLAVEPRVMFDGAAVATADVALDFSDLGSRQAEAETAVRVETARLAELADKAVELPAAPVESGPRQLLVIDTGVADWQSLISNLPSEVNVLVLDPSQNALSQIAQRAQALGEVSALHVISHGESGGLVLGGLNVDASELSRSQAALQAIGQSMTANGDILLYGCDVAAGSAGAAFIAELAQYTQADVAASTDLTGAAALGGDWTLEATSGQIETGVILSAKVMDSYQNVLIPGFEPILSVQKGAVTDDVSAGSPTRTFTVDDSTTIVAESTLIAAAGTGGDSVALAITTANYTSLDTDESNLDGSDSVRYAVVVTNTAPGDFMAFDVRLSDELPPGVNLSDVSNFRVSRGDGTVLYDGTALTQANVLRGNDSSALADLGATMAAFFNGAEGLEFVDPTAFEGVLRGANNPDSSPNTSGSNVLIVTYDVTIDATNTAVSEAGKSLTSSATLFAYSDTDTGTNLINGAPLSEEATITIAGASITKVVLGTSEPHTTVTDVAIGEEVTYQVIITVPEGTHLPVLFHDCLDDEQGVVGSGNFLAGMSLLGVDSVTFSAGLSSDKGTDLASLQASGAVLVESVNGFADRSLKIDFNQLTNTNTDNTTPETITIVYRTLVLNRPQNQENTLLLNYAEVKVDDVQQDFATDGVRVREPVWAITVVPDSVIYQPGDTVNFTVCVTGSVLDGFNGTLDSMLANIPSGLTYVPGTFAVDVGASTGLGIIADLATMSATIARLSPGQQACFTFQATVDAGVSSGQTLNVPATVRYSSLPLDPDNTGTLSATLTETTVGGLQQDSERTGAQGVGGALNDYAATNVASVIIDSPQAVLTIVQTSEINTSPASGNPLDPGLAENITVAVGEVVRYRALVRLPEGSSLDAGIQVALPDGMRFLNDGAVTYGFVSDGALTSSTLSGALADGGTPVNAADIAALRPTALLPGSAIVRVGGGTVFASGDDVRFLLGDLVNADGDPDGEWVVVEFNAVVADQLSNQDALTNHRGSAGQVTATALSTQFDFVTQASAVPSVEGTSDIDTVTVREPAIVDLSKAIVARAGDNLTFTVTFSNTGTEEAYNVHLLDDFSTTTNFTAGSLVVTGVTSSAAHTDNSTGNTLDIVLARLNPGETVSVTYTLSTAHEQALPAQLAIVTYEGLSTSGQSLTAAEGGVPLAGVPISTPGDVRIGVSYVADSATVDNYVDQVSIGSAVITGRLWDDTNLPGPSAADDIWDAGSDQALAGLTVTLVWVGPGPAPAGLPVSTVTDANGVYTFTGLPAGNYQVLAPAGTSIVAPDGPLNESFERDGTLNRVIDVALAEGTKSDLNDFAYVQINDAPTISVPTTTVTMNEDDTLCFDGGSGTVAGVTHLGLITVGDPEAYDPNTQSLTLVATNGTLDIGTLGSTESGLLAGVTVSGDRTASLSLTGTRADINALLATLCYKPNTNFFGAAQIQLTMNDAGNGGDLASGNGTPFEAVADNLQAVQTIAITVVNVPDLTEARPDEQTIAEPNPLAIAALTGNAVRSSPGANAPGDVVDFDADGDVLTVTGVAGTNAAELANTYLSTGVGSTIAGVYGDLVMNADGTYTYTPNANAQTIPQGSTVQDVFSYTISDLGATNNRDTTTLTINITGANDGPVALPDTNAIHGWSTAPTTGNAVTGGSTGDQADSDPDAGDVLQVIGVQAGLLPGAATGNVGTALTGAHGTVTLNSDGSYSYLVNPADPAVLALNSATDTLTDTFTYTVSDGKGGTATTTLIITIDGRNDPPAGTDKSFVIPEDSAPIPLTPSDFGFSDPDNGDGFKAVRIDTLPVAASGVLTLNGVPVTVGQIIPFANISQLAFAPAANVNSTTLGGDPGFNFSVCDINGPEFDPAPNRISFSISPVNDPPTAPDEVFTVPRDATLNTVTSKLAAVVGPTDPDLPADTLQIQILSLPPASQGSFYRPGAAGPVAVVVGDLLTPAELQQMCFVPASTISGTPNPDGTIPAGTLGYKVTDVTGATANGSITINVPPNLPPVAPDQVFVVPLDTTINSSQSTLNNLTDQTDSTSGVKLPTDPDQPASSLALTITTLPDASTQGVFYKPGTNGTPTPLLVGDVLTPAQLQALQFVPAAGLTGTPDAEGLISAGRLTYLASDGRGGVDPGSIAINVRPLPSVTPPPLVPVPVPLPPGAPTPVPQPAPTPISRNFDAGVYDRLADEVRLSQLPDRTHFDPFNPLAVKNTEAVMDRVEKGEVGKAKAEKPAREEDDCEPSRPKVKIKPKAVKRAIVEDKMGPKVKNFSEMLNSEKKRFKPPVKLKPKPAAEKVC